MNDVFPHKTRMICYAKVIFFFEGGGGGGVGVGVWS